MEFAKTIQTFQPVLIPTRNVVEIYNSAGYFATLGRMNEITVYIIHLVANKVKITIMVEVTNEACFSFSAELIIY